MSASQFSTQVIFVSLGNRITDSDIGPNAITIHFQNVGIQKVRYHMYLKFLPFIRNIFDVFGMTKMIS